MKRIGILIESTKSDPYFHETVRALAQGGNAELFFALAPRDDPSRAPAFMRWVTGLEIKLLAMLFSKLRTHRQKFDLGEFDHIGITNLNGRMADDLETLRALDLDLIVCGDARTPDPRLAAAAKDGVLSFQTVSPFWQVYHRQDSAAFEIQLRDGTSSRALLHGEVPTRRSFSETVVTLYETGFPWLTRLAVEYAASGKFPAPRPAADVAPRWPNPAHVITYAARTKWLLLVYFSERKIFKRFKRWGVAYAPGDWTSADRARGTRIRNLPGRYFADPFLASRDGRTVCFVEDFSFAQKRARISAVEILDDRNYKFLGPAIEEPFHMSFPYVFEYNRDLYMIPETSAANSIRLYKCAAFPMKWEFQKELLTNIRTADSMLFEHEGHWWLLTNPASPGGTDFSSQLFAFHAAHPLADSWTPHAQNPLVFDSRSARNGGLLRLADGTLARARQGYAFNLYGARLTLAQIHELTPSAFREEQIRSLAPDFSPGLQGGHHLFSNGRYTVYDFVRTEGLK